MEYARLAKLWADGDFSLSTNHFTYRWTIIGFTGLSYKIFGMSDFSSALPSLTVTFLTMLLIFFVTMKKHPAITIAALTLFITNYWTLFYSDKIMPDIYVALSVLGAVTVYWHYRYEIKGRYTLAHSVVFTGFLFFGFLSKETIILLFPLFLFIFISDLFRKQNLKFWIASALIASALLLLYFLLLKYKTGNPWIRAESIAMNSYMSPCRYDLLPVSELLKRISYLLWGDMIRQVMLCGVIFIIPALFVARFRELMKMPCQETFFLTVSVITLLCANFMTTSIGSYVPLCVDVRHYLFLTPLIAIAAAPYMLKFINFREGRIILPVIVSGFAVVSLFYDYNTLFTYIPLLVLVILRSALPVILNRKIRAAFFVLILASLVVQPVTNSIKDRSAGFGEIQRLIDRHFKTAKPSALVLTDPVLKRISDYYMEFDTSRTRFVSFYDSPSVNFKEYDNTYILFNDYTWWLSAIENERLPLFIHNLNDTVCLVTDSIKGMRLLKIKNTSSLLSITWGSKYTFISNFDSPASENWIYQGESVVNEQYHSGNFSNMVPPSGYSATLTARLDSIASGSTVLTEVTVSGYAFLANGANGQIVVSLEDGEGKSVEWLGKPLSLDCREYNKWLPFRHTGKIKIPFEKPALVFKIYVWNNGDKNFYIDDLEVIFHNINHL